MSHIVEMPAAEVRDPVAIQAACQRLQLLPPVEGRHLLFSEEVAGLGVQLPDWRYPIICDTTTGNVSYDNYGGRWGDPSQLGRFLQAYAVEKARIEARRRGHTVTEQPLADGSIKVRIHVGGQP